MSDPIRVAAAVIWREGRVLLGQRPAGGPDPERWEFPGGKLQPGETPAVGLARELEEELGIASAIGPLLGETYFEPASGRPPLQLEFYAAEITSGMPKPRHHQALRWVTPVELLALDLLPGDRAFAHRLAALTGTTGP